MDGDAEYYRIKSLLEKGLELEEADLFKLILLPLMKSVLPEAEMTIKAAELAKSSRGKSIAFVIGSIIAITDKFLPIGHKKRLLEVLRMTQIEEWLREEGKQEGRQEGRQEGKQEGKVEGKMEGKQEVARNALLEGLDAEIVARITDLPLKIIQKIKADLTN